MIHLYSGDGKGKTSIANGMAVRMAGAGNQVLYARFMKGSASSELASFYRLPQIKVLEAGKDFPFYKQMSDEDKAEITKCHNRILTEILDGVENREGSLMIILDEITYPCRWNLVDVSLLRGLIDNLPDDVELVMTGRNPMDFMMECADYWSEVTMKKHPYEKGVAARVGIEM